jgi:hypothetical protein
VARITSPPVAHTNNVQEVAQTVAPSSRIVCADNDPLVLARARALLTSSSEGRTAYIHADLRDPQSILSNPLVREVLDFSQPSTLVIVAVLHSYQTRTSLSRSSRP